MNDVIFDVANTVKDLNSVIENLLLLLSDKEKTVVTKRFCLSGSRKYTLEEIGKEFSVTRERVRQIEKNALQKMKRNVFNTALRGLHEYVISDISSNGGMVRRSLFYKNLSSKLPENISFDKNEMHFALVLNDDLECVGNTINFHPYFREQSLTDYALKFASNQLVNQLHKYGDAVEVEKIHKDLDKVLKEVDFDERRTKSLVTIDKRLALLDNDLVALLEWRHIRPRTLRDKILYILKKEGKPLHFTDISKKIEEEKFSNRAVNTQAVHNELIRFEKFVLIGRGIYALNDWGYKKGTVMEVLERILSDGKEYSEADLIEKVLERRRVKKITIKLALKNSDKFKRVGRKVYKLKA